MGGLNLWYAPNVLLALVAAAGVFIIFLAIVRSPQLRLRGVGKILAEDAARAAPVEGAAPTWQELLQVHLDQAELAVTVGEFLRIVCVSTSAALAVGWLILGGPAAGLICALLVFLLYWTYLEDQRDKRRQAYQEALPDMIDFIRASYSVAAGMAFVTVCEQLGADPRVVDGRQQNPPIPIVQPDFKWMAAQLRLNRPLDEVLDQIAAQRHDAILNLVFAALRLQQKYRGAEIAAVLAEIAETVRNLVSVRRRVRAEQTKITWEGRIMCLAPFAFLFLIQITAPAYSRPFYATPMGQIAIIAAGVLSLLAYFIMRRIANSITAQLEIQPYPPLYTAAQLEQSLRQVPQPAAGRSA